VPAGALGACPASISPSTGASTPSEAITRPSPSSTAAPRAPTIAAVGATTRAATSAGVVASVIRPRIASWSFVCSALRQEARTGAGGASPSRNPAALTSPSTAATTAAAESFEPWNAVPMIATVIAADANDSMRIRLLATPGWPRPARQSRTDTTTDRTVQCIRNAST